jgi:glycosyltransferase involved in cell wall biosynthesis
LRSVFEFHPVPGGFEVLVVDGNSDDGTKEILDRWKRESKLRVFGNPERIVPVAMNIGIRKARGKWVMRLDAHSVYPKDYLRKCYETALKTKAENVGGVFVSMLRVNTLEARLVQALTTHRFGVGNAGFRVEAKEGFADTVPFGFYQRDLFSRIGLFDERLIRNQDYELNRRLLRSGGRIWMNPEIQVYYFNQTTLGGLARQAFVTGKYNVRMWAIAPYTFAFRHIAPGAFVLGILAATLLSMISDAGRLLLLAIAGPYVVVSLVSSVQQGKRLGWRLLPVLPFGFLFYHTAYGVGVLIGILRELSFHNAVLRLLRKPFKNFVKAR